MKKTVFALFPGLLSMLAVFAQSPKQVLKQWSTTSTANTILPGAYQINEYVPLLKGKRVGIFANNTAIVKGTHLVDTLKKLGITITKIFGPEHGFRGTANAGSHVENYVDEKTGIPVISLYGTKRKPSQEDLLDVDILLFDIQDVGVRFYTYISSLQEFMESAMKFDKPLVVLDRPNPNGFYVDGPVLDTTFKSFVGMQPVPVVYGMTIGEYANFLLGEGLLEKKIVHLQPKKTENNTTDASKRKESGWNLTVIKCRNYTHKSKYILPVRPSPNLPDAGSVYWYPSTCFFEGTVLSEGRGTDKPFQVFGHPSLPNNLYAFTPVANAGASSPKLKDQLCYGWNLSGTNEKILEQINNRIQIKYLLEAYKLFPDKKNFFLSAKKSDLKPTDYFFNKLAGNAELMQQVSDGKTESEIRASWEPKLTAFRKKRKKYLLYPDFDSQKP